MNTLLENIDLIALICGGVASAAGIVVAIWSLNETRQRHVDEFIERRKIRKDMRDGS